MIRAEQRIDQQLDEVATQFALTPGADGLPVMCDAARSRRIVRIERALVVLAYLIERDGDVIGGDAGVLEDGGLAPGGGEKSQLGAQAFAAAAARRKEKAAVRLRSPASCLACP